MRLDSYYFGMITNVYPPDSVDNVSKYQYEYQVLITGEDYAQIPTRCIRADLFGSRGDFEDVVLEVATKVMVLFPRGERSVGVIQSGTRNYVAPINGSLGKHWRNRFNKIVRYIDKDGNYSVTSDQGPNLSVKTDKIVIDDSSGNQIILDKASKTLFIKSGELKIDVSGNIALNVAKDSNVSVTGDCNVKVSGKAKIEVSGDCEVKAATISLNGKGGKVLTTESDPIIDSIFGEPSTGVDTVKAGE
jgi:hypothetical protein